MLDNSCAQNVDFGASNNLTINQQLRVTTGNSLEQLGLIGIIVHSGVELGVRGLASSQLVLTALLTNIGVSGTITIIGLISNDGQIHSDSVLTIVLQNIVSISSLGDGNKLGTSDGLGQRLVLIELIESDLLGSAIGITLIVLQVLGNVVSVAGLSIVCIILLSVGERHGAQCQSHDHGQHSCNDLLHVCFLHKNLFVSGSASFSETAFTT